MLCVVEVDTGWLRTLEKYPLPMSRVSAKAPNSRNPFGHLRSSSLVSGTSAGSCVPERSQSSNCVVYHLPLICCRYSQIIHICNDICSGPKSAFLIVVPREFWIALLKQRRLGPLTTTLAWLSCNSRLCENVDV